MAQAVTIGGTTALARNIIAGIAGPGIEITGLSFEQARADVVEGNYIGTDITGAHALPNVYGIEIDGGAGSNTIGGTATTPGTGAGNVISGNTTAGVYIVGQNIFTPGNLIEGNLIGANAANTAALPNLVGILTQTSSGNTIGGVTATPGEGPGNDIWGNTLADIEVGGAPTEDDIIQGNVIGRNIAGTAPTSVLSGAGVECRCSPGATRSAALTPATAISSPAVRTT